MFCILALLYYSAGSLLLPLADFSFIPELPEMYSHCKTTEDKDMDLMDFVTDHLMNIDGMFDKHEAGDDQRPHKPLDHSTGAQLVFVPLAFACEFNAISEPSSHILYFTESKYHFDFAGDVFRPPIV